MFLLYHLQEGLSDASDSQLEFIPAVSSTPVSQNASVRIK